MIVYHGSDVSVPEPRISFSRERVDFGKGFYVTPIAEQAQRWAARFLTRGRQALISCYELDEAAFAETSICRFDGYTEDWLDFVLACRSGHDTSTYDIVMGGVANDRVFDTVELYLQGLIEKNTAIERLRFEAPNYQIAVRTQAVLDRYLQFQRSEHYEGK